MPASEEKSLMDRMMEATDPAEARELFDAYVDVIARYHVGKKNPPDAVDIAKSNLGYMAGYYEHDVRLRVERLYNCVHPVLGPAPETPPTHEEMFEAGARWAKGELKRFEQPKDEG